LGLTPTIVTQHVVFDIDVQDRLVLMDEIFLLPEWHVRAIAGLSSRSIGFGDYCQTADLGFGQTAQSVFSCVPGEFYAELPTSFTVPQDVMALAHRLQLIPDHYRSLSSVHDSMFALRSIANFSCPVVTGSRECKVGFTNSLAYTIVTIQGARVESLVAHMCGRDLTVLDPAGTFATGMNRKKLLWTMLSRHSQRLYLDLAPAFSSSFGDWNLPFAENNDDIEYLPDPAFRVILSPSQLNGVVFNTFTPVTVEFVSPIQIRIYNNFTSVTRMLVHPFNPIPAAFQIVDTYRLQHPVSRSFFDIVRS
jgi:hypothetical protein